MRKLEELFRRSNICQQRFKREQKTEMHNREKAERNLRTEGHSFQMERAYYVPITVKERPH